jgi:cell division transport system ATP-binding protein
VVLFDGVAVRYGAGPEVLRGISFTLAPGSFHFLVGPSGAGKSSLLKLIYLGLRPAAGRVELFGRNVSVLKRSDYPAMRRRIGVVFQDFRLIEHLSAMDNVALPLRIAGVRESDIKRHVPELLAWVGLKHHLDALPATLSGGQQQRVAIARAVISRPSLLLADEPTGNVDDNIGVRLMYLFEELNKMGTTVVIATHNEGLVGRFSHRQLRIADGTVRLTDPTVPDPTVPDPTAPDEMAPDETASDEIASGETAPHEMTPRATMADAPSSDAPVPEPDDAQERA